MCGILFTDSPRVSESQFSSALGLLNHRGPDAQGTAAHQSARLGHTRLKIVDLETRSNQPFYSADGRYLMVYNGEIYNHAELARRHGLSLRTTSDTEVLLELFARHGAACLEWLNGMFAFVILDRQTNEVFAARDRLGVKPLYVRRTPTELTFASELSPVLALHGTPAFDPIGVRQYRKLRTFFNGRTLYAGIEMFPAGHYFADGRFHRYWELPEGPQDPPSDEELRALVEDAVRDRLMSDVPVGSYLSGGLDSTLVAALAEQPHTWTVGFPDDNEFEWGRIAAEHIHSNHHEVLMQYGEFQEIAREMIQRRREPLSVPNEVLLHKMTQAVKTENSVVLSGEGADELFFGYDRIFRWAAEAPQWDIEAFTRLYAYGSYADPEIVEDALAPFLNVADPLGTVARFFQIAHLHGLLRRLDNSTMLSAVEARVPFVDHHPLVERMAGVPVAYRMADGIVKAPLKRVFRDRVPSAIIDRRKVGFPVALERIFPGPERLTPMDRWLNFNLAVLGVESD